MINLRKNVLIKIFVPSKKKYQQTEQMEIFSILSNELKHDKHPVSFHQAILLKTIASQVAILRRLLALKMKI